MRNAAVASANVGVCRVVELSADFRVVYDNIGMVREVCARLASCVKVMHSAAAALPSLAVSQQAVIHTQFDIVRVASWA
jgi:hydroxymethylglutaryl-CoA reductase